MKKPGFWRLFEAYLIDFIITFFAAWIIWKLFWVCFPHAFTDLSGKASMVMLWGILIGCASIPNWLYFAE